MPTLYDLPECEDKPVDVLEYVDDKEAPIYWSEVEVEVDLKVDAQVSVSTKRREFASKGLEAEIKQAQRIVELRDDWDGEGSAGYSQATIDRAVGFLTRHVRGLWESYGIECPIPRIGPGPEGSIDIHWKQPSWELLVNIAADEHAMAAFYGDNYGVQRIRGSFDPTKFNLGIAEWLRN
jgi:hypothetical protein